MRSQGRKVHLHYITSSSSSCNLFDIGSRFYDKILFDKDFFCYIITWALLLIIIFRLRLIQILFAGVRRKNKNFRMRWNFPQDSQMVGTSSGGIKLFIYQGIIGTGMKWLLSISVGRGFELPCLLFQCMIILGIYFIFMLYLSKRKLEHIGITQNVPEKNEWSFSIIWINLYQGFNSGVLM